MAYMSQEHKKRINAELKKVMPKGWKYSLAVRHHSTIVCTIKSAPVDLVKLCRAPFYNETGTYTQVNHYHYHIHCHSSVVDQIGAIVSALHLDHYDNSDPMTDYFNCSHYVSLNIGSWDRPFKITGDAK